LQGGKIPQQNNKTYISSGPKIPNCTYTIELAIIINNIFFERTNIPLLCALVALKTACWRRKGLPWFSRLTELEGNAETGRPGLTDSLSRRRFAMGARTEVFF